MKIYNVLDVECPTCKAGVGYPCFAQQINKRNVVNSCRRDVKPHSERKALYKSLTK